MAKTQGQVTKIYELKTIGYQDITKQLGDLAKKFEAVKKAKNEALKQKANANEEDAKKVEELNKKIQKEIELERQLTLEIKKKTAERKRLKLVEEAAKNAEFTKTFNDNSINKALAENKILKKERGDLNELIPEQKKRIDELNVTIDKNTELIKRNSSAQEKQRFNIGNYEGSAKIIVEALERARQKVDQVTQSFGQASPEAKAARHEFETLDRITQNPQFLNISAKVGDANAELKFFTKALIDLERRGEGSSQAANELRFSLAKLTDEIKDTKAEVRALSSDTRQFDLVAGGISTLTSGLQTAVGLSGLFGDSSEEVAKKLVFLSAVENTANGVRAIANDFTTRGTAANKVYAFVQGLVSTALDKTAVSSVRAAAGIKLFFLSATVIGALVVAFVLLNKKISELEQRQKNLNEVFKEAGSAYGTAIQQISELRVNIDLAKQGFISKKDVLKQYNESVGKTTGEVKSLDEAEQALNKNADKYIEFTFKKAVATAAFAKAGQLAVQAQEELLLPITKTPILAITEGLTPENERAEKLRLEEQRGERVERLEKQKQDLIDFATEMQVEVGRLSKILGFDFFGDGKDKDKKTNEVKDQLAIIDGIRDTAIANEQARVLEIKKLRDLTLDEEIEHQKAIEKINLRALDEKIKFLDERKKRDAGELKALAEFKRARVETEISTLEEIQKAKDKEFEKQEKSLREQLDRDKESARKQQEDIEGDPSISSEGKVRQKLAADAAILDLQEAFNKEIDRLEKELNQKSTENAKDGAEAVKQIKRDINEDIKELALARLDDITTEGEEEIRKEEVKFSKLRQTILENNKTTQRQKQDQLEKLAKAEKRTILSKELDLLNKQLELKKELLRLNLISNEEYQKAVLAQQQKAEELAGAVSEKEGRKKFSIQGIIRGLFNAEEGSEIDEVIGEILVQSYSLAMDAMNNFFDAERERIRENLDLQLERLEMEKEQVLNRAQSQAEIESIEKQFAARKKKAERDAQEQFRKSKRAEAKIAFAVELAHIAVQASQYPFPASLIIGGILAGIAAGRLAMNLSAINREKFEKGGAPSKRGGQAKGKSHKQGGIPFNYEAENKELFIVNKRSAEDRKVRTLTGTNKQIASMINQLGGGVSFAKGARSHTFAEGGSLGQRLQAPVFTPSSNITNITGRGVSNEKFDELMNKLELLAEEQSNRIDRLEVVQKTSTVTDAQKKQVKQSSIGTL